MFDHDSKEKKKKPNSLGVRFAENPVTKVHTFTPYPGEASGAKQSHAVESIAPSDADVVAELHSEQPPQAPEDIQAAYSILGQVFITIAPGSEIEGQYLAMIYRSMAEFLEGWKSDVDVSQDAQVLALLDNHPFASFMSKAASGDIVVQKKDIKSTPDLNYSVKILSEKSNVLGQTLQDFLKFFIPKAVVARQWRKLGEAYAEFGLAMLDAGLSTWSGKVGNFFGKICVEYHLAKAMHAFSTALQTKPDHKEYKHSLRWLAELQRRTGRNDDARKSYEEYLKKYPGNIKVFVNLVKIDRTSKIHLISAIALLEEYRGLYRLMATRNQSWQAGEEKIAEEIRELKKCKRSLDINSAKLESKTVMPDARIKSYYAEHFPLPPEVAALQKSFEQSLKQSEEEAESQNKGSLSSGRPPS